jgi:hypothetical protein
MHKLPGPVQLISALFTIYKIKIVPSPIEATSAHMGKYARATSIVMGRAWTAPVTGGQTMGVSGGWTDWADQAVSWSLGTKPLRGQLMHPYAFPKPLQWDILKYKVNG